MPHDPEDGKHRSPTFYPGGKYAYFSNTSSGWTISTNPNASKEKRWRAIHPQFGTKYFAEHDDILKFTLENMREHLKKLMEKDE